MLDEQSFLRVSRNIASGLLHIHRENVTHGDIKPHKVLLTSPIEVYANGTRARFRPVVHVKLADFGLSRRTADLLETVNTSDFGNGPMGTFAYTSPESFDGVGKKDGEVAKAADVYAFGVVMYEQLTGRQLWIAENVRSVWKLCKIVCNKGQSPFWGNRRGSICEEYVEFVERCWTQNYAEIPSPGEIAKKLNQWEAAYKLRTSSTIFFSTPLSRKEVSPGVPERIDEEIATEIDLQDETNLEVTDKSENVE